MALVIIAGYVWVVWSAGWVGLAFAALHLGVIFFSATIGGRK